MGRGRGGLLGRDVLETDPVGPWDEVDEGLEARGADRPGDGRKGGVLEVVDGDAAIKGGLLGVSLAYRPVQQQQFLVDLVHISISPSLSVVCYSPRSCRISRGLWGRGASWERCSWSSWRRLG
ncbi:hypothetical protein H113_07696 [Trichophyton rubrum MR1459]|nr:hypothetical protein H113_07696 [Trichophyton rubrum MR1459]EZG02410.1 hypothetical protein H106_07473 [Trichophyton rubrum CBS 735.88]